MAIIIEEGVPGAGKTFDSLIRFALPAIARGRRLYTNIDGLNIPLIASLTDRSPEDVRGQVVEVPNAAEWIKLLTIAEADRVESRVKENPLYQSICIIDESQMVWPRAGHQKSTTQGFKDLLAWHRHLRMDMIFLTQSAKTLEAYVSELCAACYSVKNLAFISSMMGRVYVINVRERPGAPLTTTLYGRYDPKYFGIYKTAVGEANSAYALKVPQAIGNVVAFAVLSVAFYMGFHFYTKGIFGGSKKKNVLSNRAVAAVAPKENLEIPLRDSVADPSLKKPTVPKAVAVLSPAPAELTAVEKADKGLPADQNCYRVPSRGTWSITFRGETERGWKDTVREVCY